MSYVGDNHLEIKDLFQINTDAAQTVLTPCFKKKNILILDEGLVHTALCKSDISKIDGRQGQLLYRGRPIETLLNTNFMHVAHDLIMPLSEQSESKENFAQDVLHYFFLADELKVALDALPASMHSMHFLSAGISTVSALEKRYLREVSLLEQMKFLIAQVSVVAVYYLLRQTGRAWKQHVSASSLSGHIVSQLTEADDVKVLTQVFNTILLLHAEHGQNCSTMTARNVASARGDVYAAVTAGIAGFSGQLHGGASQCVGEMYEHILARGISANTFVDEKIYNKERIMGFGHRVYSCWDPRAKVMFNLLNSDSAMFESVQSYRAIGLDLVKRVAEDPFFVQRGICPNPDLFNGLFYRLLGASSKMNGVMLCMSRVVGWIAHYYEHFSTYQPIIRPRQVPSGAVSQSPVASEVSA